MKVFYKNGMVAFAFVLLLLWLVASPWACNGSSNTPDAQENTPDTQESLTEKAPGEPSPPENSCTPPPQGQPTNSCQGSESCKAARDLSDEGCEVEGSCVAGLCAPKPPSPAGVKKDNNYKTPPDLSCLSSPPSLPSGPDKTTFWGPVETFGLNKGTTDIKVEAFDYQKDPDLKNPLTTATSAPPKESGTCSPACEKDKVCLHNRCVSSESSNHYPIGYIELADLPTNRLLVLRASGKGFVTTVEYNVWIPADKPKDGYYRDRAYIITELSKTVISAAAGISGISPGNGAVAGEIMDCQGRSIKGATVTLSLIPQKLAYFDGEETPDPAQNETSTDGLYAALDIKPSSSGELSLVAAAQVSGKTVEVSSFRLKLFPEQIVILNLTPWYPGKK